MVTDAPQWFDMLLCDLPKCRKLAEDLKTPNPEDDFCVRMAIVGFSFKQPTEAWDMGYLKFINVRRAGDLSDTVVEEWGGAAIAAFGCLCLGYLLALHRSHEISDDDFKTADAHLAGFIALKRNEILNWSSV